MAKKNKYCGGIKVGFNTYRIQRKGGLSADDGQGLLGQANHSNFRIILSKGYSRNRNYQTLWHEIIHAIARERNLELPEEVVGQISNGLVMVLHDNPQLIDMIEQEIFIRLDKKG
jgi:hypothetical protein